LVIILHLGLLTFVFVPQPTIPTVVACVPCSWTL
jgi:hypothetical protein